MNKSDTTKSIAGQIAYDILAPLGCKDFDGHWQRATELIYRALAHTQPNTPPYPGLWFHEKDGTIRTPTTRDI